MKHLLEVRGISKEYPTKPALRNVSFTIERGRTLGIIGPSGSGKTTLLRLTNLLETPTSGEIIFDGTSLSRADEVKVRRRMTMVFQNPVVFKRSVYENVAYGLRIRREKEDNVRKRVKEALDMVGLAGFERRAATTLSGGEAQRVVLARAIVVEPELLLLDEPTANLDPANVTLMENVISTINKTKGTTIIMATHTMFQAERLTDEAGFLLEGELVEMGETKEVFGKPKDPRTRAFIKGEMVY